MAERGVAIQQWQRGVLAIGARRPGGAVPALIGTGFIVDLPVGLICTCAHVVIDAFHDIIGGLDPGSPGPQGGLAIGFGSGERIHWVSRAVIKYMSRPPFGYPRVTPAHWAQIPQGADNLDLAILQLTSWNGEPLSGQLCYPKGEESEGVPVLLHWPRCMLPEWPNNQPVEPPDASDEQLALQRYDLACALLLGDVATLREGTTTLVMLGYGQDGTGRGVERTSTTTRGCFSGNYTSATEGVWLKTDVMVLSGHSGGPVLNRRGEVIGWAVKSNQIGQLRPINSMLPALGRVLAVVAPGRVGAHVRQQLQGHVSDDERRDLRDETAWTGARDFLDASRAAAETAQNAAAEATAAAARAGQASTSAQRAAEMQALTAVANAQIDARHLAAAAAAKADVAQRAFVAAFSSQSQLTLSAQQVLDDSASRVNGSGLSQQDLIDWNDSIAVAQAGIGSASVCSALAMPSAPPVLMMVYVDVPIAEFTDAKQAAFCKTLAGALLMSADLNVIRPDQIRVERKPMADAVGREQKRLWRAAMKAGRCYVKVHVSDEYMPSYSSSSDDSSSVSGASLAEDDEDVVEDEEERQLREAVKVAVATKMVPGPCVTADDIEPQIIPIHGPINASSLWLVVQMPAPLALMLLESAKRRSQPLLDDRVRCMRLVDSGGVLREQRQFVAQLDDRPDIHECLATLEAGEAVVLAEIAREMAAVGAVPVEPSTAAKEDAEAAEERKLKIDEAIRRPQTPPRILFAPDAGTADKPRAAQMIDDAAYIAKHAPAIEESYSRAVFQKPAAKAAASQIREHSGSSGGREHGREHSGRSSRQRADSGLDGSEGGSASGSPAADADPMVGSCASLVVTPVLVRMLGAHQDKQVQKALAQLKLAFDNLERLRPSISRDVLTQMFELVVSSKNPSVSSLMPPSVAALAAPSIQRERAADPVARIGELLQLEAQPQKGPQLSSTAAGTGQDTGGGWTAQGWLLSLAPELSAIISSALLPGGADDEFGALRGLSKADVEARLAAAGLSGLAPIVARHAALLSGQAAATGAALNDKFNGESGTFALAFGTLDTFYQGLEGLIGPPLLVGGSLQKAMEQEHTAFDDSGVEFTSSNGITTTSATEWEAACAPQPGRAYPDRFASGDEHQRSLVALDQLRPAMEERNAQLGAIKQSAMVVEELLATRLYHKYNLVLRSFSGVEFLKAQFERDCKGNLYATTIHGINSAVIKLSKLQVACPVYRGSTRAVLPREFWEKDGYGLSGGVEFGFTSTTVERGQAVHYAQGQASLVFESAMGLIDRGADVSWLSQYPHEREVLFGPLLGQQPLATRVDGGTLVVQTRMSLNMMSLTLEQVLNKRFRLLKEMGAGMVLEVRAALAGSGAEVREALRLRGELDTDVLSHKPERYNEDEAFLRAVETALKLKNAKTGMDALQKLEQSNSVVQRLVVAKLEDSDGGVREAAVQTVGKLPPEAIATHVAAVLAKLEDSYLFVREAAVETLGKLPPEALATHAAAVLAKLEHSDGGVRRAAVKTLGKLPPEALMTHTAAVLAKLEDSDDYVREAAVKTLGKLPPEALATHAAAVLAKLEDSNGDVRKAARVETLGKLPPEAFATHAAAVLAKLEHSDPTRRWEAVETLGNLPPEALATHAAAVLAKLEDSDRGVRRAAVETLGKLPPEALATHAAAVLAKLEDSDPFVREAAVATLGKLLPEALVTHADAVVAKLEDSVWDVRQAAVETLGMLPPEALATRAAAVLAKLEDSDEGVRRAAVETLGKLPPEALLAHGVTSISLAEAELLDAQLRGSEWSSSEDGGVVNEVNDELKWNRKGKEPEFAIARTGALVSTNGWWAVRMSVDAGRVESVQWQNSLRDGADVLIWTRI